MSAFLTAAASTLLLIVATGLLASLGRRSAADRMMAAQLLGTGTIAALLLVGVGTGAAGSLDLALTLALLAPFAVIGLAISTGRTGATTGGSA